MIVVDTTVLAYAAGGEHPLRLPCRRVFDAANAGLVDVRTSTFVIQEFLHVVSRRRSREDAVMLTGSYADLLSPLVVLDPAQVPAALDLYRRHERLDAFDAFLAATALAASATLVSADRAFATVAGLRWVSPAEPALEDLLA